MVDGVDELHLLSYFPYPTNRHQDLLISASRAAVGQAVTFELTWPGGPYSDG